MTISSLDPSGELGRLFSTSQAKSVVPSDQRQSKASPLGHTGDDVALSVFAREVRDLTNQVVNQPDVREDRVETIREALEKNRSLANAEQIADALSRDTILNTIALS
ncbi:MAG: flagellar biosynthesis anti-sigma factor FlgM [Nitrospirales bacterium]